MSLRRFTALMASAVCAIQLTVSSPASGQELGELIDQSINLMQQQNWAAALKISEDIVKDHGGNAEDTYGPRFGGVYFRKGVCELKLKKWDAAISSFEICYKNFANKPGNDGNTNPFHKTCLLQWAEAAMGKKDWQQALDLFDKFIKERDREKDRYSQGPFFTSLAICHYNLGDFVKGNENFEIVIQNQEKFRVSDAMLINVFRYLAEAALREEGKEQALLDFIKKNRGAVNIDAFDMYPFAPAFIKMANDALKSERPRAAVELYMLVPGTELALADAKDKMQDLGLLPRMRISGGETLIKKQLESGIEQLEKSVTSDQNVEMIKLSAAAFLHEQHSNLPGAFAAFRLLEEFYPNAQNREDNLFNLARLAFAVDASINSLQYAQRFLDTFPQSPKVPVVRRLMLSSLFVQGKYEECIEIANEIIGGLPKPSPQHDICLHVLGGSYYYTGQYDLAAPHLEKHVTDYQNSDSKVAAAYFHGSNYYRLGDYQKAGELLDAFIGKYPNGSENAYLPFALLDRANCFFMTDQNEPALAKCDLLIKDFPECNILDQAHLLRGNILMSMDNLVDAEGAYQQGLRIAERNGSPFCAEAIYHLLGLLIKESGEGKPLKRLEEAIAYVDKFWKQFAEDSPGYAREIAVLQMPILEQADRLDEGVERLRKIIVEMANEDPTGGGIEDKLDAYTEGYMKKHTPDQAKAHFLAFDGIPKEAKAVNALLLVKVIGIYGDVAKEAQKKKDESAEQAATNMVKALFERLKQDYDVKELTPSVLVKVGDYLRLKTATPREALRFYNEILERKDKANEFPALLGRADINGNSTIAADIDQALADFQKIYDSTEKKNEKEFALFRMIELLMAKKDYEKVSERCRQFLDKDSGFQKSRQAPVVGLFTAQAFEGRKMTEDAIAMYAKVWATHKGAIKAAAPAMKRYMELLWERNNPAPVPAAPGQYGDRQSAYIAGATWIQQTTVIRDRMNEEDRALWEQVDALAKQYAANPNIKNLEQLEREKKPR